VRAAPNQEMAADWWVSPYVAALCALVTFISHTCQRSAVKRNLMRRQGIISAIVSMLKSTNRRVQLKSLEVLHLLVQDNNDNGEELGKGNTICTIIKFLSNEHF
jgi:tRNA splicing ligase